MKAGALTVTMEVKGAGSSNMFTSFELPVDTGCAGEMLSHSLFAMGQSEYIAGGEKSVTRSSQPISGRHF